METAIQQLNYFPETKEQLKSFVENAKNEILNGNIDIAAFAAKKAFVIKSLEEITDDKQIKEIICSEVSKYGKTAYLGVEFGVATKTTYEWKNYNDEHLQELLRQKELIEKQIKIRQEIILSGLNSETGETFERPEHKETIYYTAKIK